MRWLRAAADEILGLFVDDPGFALAILACLAIVAILAAALPGLRPGLGFILFAGLAGVLAMGVFRGARRR